MRDVTLFRAALMALFSSTVLCNRGQCESVTISNTIRQSSMEGRYVLDPHRCADRPVYKQTSGDNFLFAFVFPSGQVFWIVGPRVCQARGGLISRSTVTTPARLYQWEEYNGIFWVSSPQVQLICTSHDNTCTCNVSSRGVRYAK